MFKWFTRDYQRINKVLVELERLNSLFKVAQEQLDYTKQIKTLKRQISDLEVSKSQSEEKNEREKREIEHMVGLEKKRQEMEKEIATKEARVSVREENLNADKKRFEEQMKFMTQRFEDEGKRREELLKAILDRLPTVNVDRQIEEKRRAV